MILVYMKKTYLMQYYCLLVNIRIGLVDINVELNVRNIGIIGVQILFGIKDHVFAMDVYVRVVVVSCIMKDWFALIKPKEAH